ncbi:hypothetical protein QAD02_017840 [Eretmocerus hayati]|uniref:Uncharacterized protein n=1 Tax=Eretmocerus hayati TaxID=131215 RepID=A0ACC2PG70_9HYME|nr:hypothetical protein QAD02_017840 [Eretmocerus hayati]
MTLMKRIAHTLLKSNSRNLTAPAQAIQIQDDPTQTFRTKENNPLKHDMQHVGRFYTVPSDVAKVIYTQGMPQLWHQQAQVFTEMSLLVRKPAVELLSYLTQTDYSKPVNKYVIYGDPGCGKSTTMLHLLHYGYKSKKIIVHVKFAHTWMVRPKEVSTSPFRENFMDLPLDAALWLQNFRLTNADLLAKADIKLSKDYEWDSCGKIEVGSPLISLIDLGINHVKCACEVVIALMTELKKASIAGKCKVLVAIDGFNAFYRQVTKIKDDLRKYVPASQVSLTLAFLDITKSDWCNGQVIVSVDTRASDQDKPGSVLPRYLLGKEGFEHLDPFMPMFVENYTQDEFDTVVEYYKNRKLITEISSEGLKELSVITGKNPLILFNYSKSQL